MTLTERVHALVFNGITAASAESDGFDSWLPLSERERFARAVVDELRAGNIEFRLGGLALLAEAVEAEQRGPDLSRFEICAVHSFGPTLDLHCTGCHRWTAHIDDPLTLAELVQRAGEHAEVCK